MLYNILDMRGLRGKLHGAMYLGSQSVREPHGHESSATIAIEGFVIETSMGDLDNSSKHEELEDKHKASGILTIFLVVQ